MHQSKQIAASGATTEIVAVIEMQADSASETETTTVFAETVEIQAPTEAAEAPLT